MSPFPSPAAEEQAALWAARLEAGRVTEHNRVQLEAWLRTDPEHAGLLKQFQTLSAALDEHLPVLAESGMLGMSESGVPPLSHAPKWRERRFRPLFLGLAGAAAAAAVALTLAIRDRPIRQSYATGPAERHTLDLADGTRIELNANSSVKVIESRQERRAQLTRGEAYFIVAKEANRPFIVETPAGTVRVTGTVFDVCDQTPGQLEVTVVDGSVQVRGNTAAARPYALKPGDHFSATSPGVERLSASALADLLAWRRGTVIFDGATLSDALAAFSRYTGRPAIADPAVAQLRVSGSWPLGQFDDFLAGLPVRWPVAVSRDDHGSIRVTARPQ